jgi:ankyrin repeat protein
VPSPFSTGRYFSWELPALCTRFLDGLHSRLVDSPSSIAPEVLFIMFLAFSLYSLDDADEAQRAREALIAAAVLGYTPAQAVARRVYAFYECSPPHEVEDRFAEWEVEAASTGSPLAQIDLQQQNDDNYIESKRFFQARGGYNAYYSSINFEWASNGVSSESDGYSYIHWLATYGSLPQMQEHLNMTANSDINSITVEGETPLYLASARGHYHIVAELLNRGADVAVHCTQFNISPVHWLFAFDVNVQSKVIGLLVDGGADLDARTAKPLPFFHFPFLLPAGTPLHWAVVTSNHTAIQALLHYGADVQIRDGSDPYMWDERVRVLNKFGGPNQEAYSFSEGETQGLSPLDHAAAQHDPFIFETLLATQRKEDMNAVDEEGFSVFHRLSTGHVLHTRMGNGFTVRPFLGRPLKMQKRLKDTVSGIKALGGNVDLLTIPIVSNAQSSQRPWSEPSYTPLMLASIDGAVNIVRALLENGANVELENDKQETAVFCLFDKVQYSEDDLKLQCLELLVSSGADINHRSKFGETPVLRAAKGRLIDSVDFCLSLGASIDERDMNPNSSHPGRPLLHFLAMEDAAFQDSEDIAVLRLLEKHVFDKPVAEQRQTINATDDQGETVLHRLCGHGMLNSVQELLAHGASVNALATSYTREHEGDEVYEVFWQMTPLDHAIRSRDLRRKRMERDRGYLNSEFQNLAERSESIIKALKDAGGVQAPEDRGRKHLVFDRSRYPEGPGAIVEARGER